MSLEEYRRITTGARGRRAHARGTDIPDYLWVAAGLPVPKKEYAFDSHRQWRIDYAFPARKLAIEIEGGLYSRRVVCHQCGAEVMRRTRTGKMVHIAEGGRHTSSGFARDCEKYNALAAAGWALLRYTPQTVDLLQAKTVYDSRGTDGD